MNHLTTRELAQRLRVSMRTDESLRVSGAGPPYLRVGNQIRYPPDAIATWEANNLQANNEKDN